MAQWVLRCKRGFIRYSHVTKQIDGVFSVSMATVFNEDPQEAVMQNIMERAREKGFKNLTWKKVKVELVFPIDRSANLFDPVQFYNLSKVQRSEETGVITKK